MKGRTKIQIGAALSALFLLSGCGHRPAPNFCKAENRQIPDLEMKGRLLLNMYKFQNPVKDPRFPNNKPEVRERAGWVTLPKPINEYLKARSPINATEYQIQQILMSYVKTNPLCCQLIVDELYSDSNIMYKVYDFSSSDYFANFYLIDEGPFFKIPPSGESEDNKLWKKTNVIGARNCGDIYAIDRG